MSEDKVSKSQAEAIKNKAAYWRSYITELAKELNSSLDYHLLREASLWASTFAHIEWLASFDHYKEPVTKTEIAETLNRAWDWDVEVSKLFWSSGRNPVAHVGLANPFHSYRKFNNLDTNVSLNSANNWSEAVTGEWDKYHPHRAVAILPPLAVEDGTVQLVTFFHQMLLDELLPKLAEYVYQKIVNEADDIKLTALVELNSQIPH